MDDMIIGVDLAKNVFQLHGAKQSGDVLFRKKLTRPQFEQFLAELDPATVVMEACGSASFWARELAKMGHEVRLIAPQYVRPFVKRQKNDAADAEALVIAARQPEMRYVIPKTTEQQAQAVVFRSRERLVKQRTELVNALRAALFEFGFTLPQGIASLGKAGEFLERSDIDIPQVVLDDCRDMLAQISEKTERINERSKEVKRLADQSETLSRLQTMPGLGPITALAISAFAPDMASFRRGRDFSAWLGLVPRQNSTGGKARLGAVSKAGQSDIRRLLIIGAMSRLNWLGRKSIRDGDWIGRLMKRKPKMLVAIALANRMARQIWAMLTKREEYIEPATPITA
jgi:transposase